MFACILDCFFYITVGFFGFSRNLFVDAFGLLLFAAGAPSSCLYFIGRDEEKSTKNCM